MANGPRGWGRLKAKTGTNPEKESLPKQEPSRVTNDSQSEPSPVNKDSGAECAVSPVESKCEGVAVRPLFNIPKLSLSSDSEAVAGPGGGVAPPRPPHTQEYSQMVANLMDFKVSQLSQSRPWRISQTKTILILSSYLLKCWLTLLSGLEPVLHGTGTNCNPSHLVVGWYEIRDPES